MGTKVHPPKEGVQSKRSRQNAFRGLGPQSQQITPHGKSEAERPRDVAWRVVLTVAQERDKLHSRDGRCAGGKKWLQQVATKCQRDHSTVGGPGEGNQAGSHLALWMASTWQDRGSEASL